MQTGFLRIYYMHSDTQMTDFWILNYCIVWRVFLLLNNIFFSSTEKCSWRIIVYISLNITVCQISMCNQNINHSFHPPWCQNIKHGKYVHLACCQMKTDRSLSEKYASDNSCEIYINNRCLLLQAKECKHPCHLEAYFEEVNIKKKNRKWTCKEQHCFYVRWFCTWTSV